MLSWIVGKIPARNHVIQLKSQHFSISQHYQPISPKIHTHDYLRLFIGGFPLTWEGMGENMFVDLLTLKGPLF